ncbi:MAG: CHAD domain-containing protein, partial [Chloroflexi bacterium]
GTRSGEDIEELHDMRVATRRMRAALDIFSSYYSPKAIKPIWKGLRRTGRNLGGVRDMDVLLEHLKGYIQTLPEAARDGMEPLVSEWQTQRELRRTTMNEFLDSKAYQRFKIQMNHFVQTPAMDRPSLVSDYPTPRLVKEAAPLLIYTRLTSVRAYETILDHASLDQLHTLRIEFKKLRYAVEFFREVLGPQAKDVINTLKKVQDHLGELNDARVTCQLLTEFVARWEIQQIQQPIGKRKTIEPVVAYLAARHADRHRLMVCFPETWETFVHSNFRQALALAVAEL